MPRIPNARRALARSAVGLALSLALSGAVPAEEPAPAPAQPTPPPPPAEKPSPSTPRTERLLSPMMQEIETLLADERVAIEALAAQVAKTQDGRALIALQLDVEARKQATQLAILEVQLRHARADGRSDAVAELERALAARKQPPVPVFASDLDPALLPK